MLLFFFYRFWGSFFIFSKDFFFDDYFILFFLEYDVVVEVEWLVKKYFIYFLDEGKGFFNKGIRFNYKNN